ncbi:hypothetical protein [Gabonia massiliensis]|uniref:hypothetical protein n=1 Tax=Gabonia massiliensis TaxID=1686296 RepID=UPI0006D7900D|nr:hypothetical protein [Gabonia massiliensis]
MGIISDSLGAAFGLGSSIYGGIRGAKERKKQEKLLNQQIQENKDLFKREYYQDIMNRSDTANILKNYRDTLKRRNKTQRNMAAVTGATPEAVAAQKKINADAYGDVISNISSQSSRLKDNALNRYTDTNNYLLGQKSNMYAQRAQNFSNLAANGIGLLTSSLQNIGNSMDKSIGNFFKR